MSWHFNPNPYFIHMQQRPKKIFLSFSGFLLINYLFIGLFCELFHNHEADLKFHDNCPACQWEAQSQNADTSLSDVGQIIQLQSIFCENNILISIYFLQSQTLVENHASRAPPSVWFNIFLIYLESFMVFEWTWNGFYCSYVRRNLSWDRLLVEFVFYFVQPPFGPIHRHRCPQHRWIRYSTNWMDCKKGWRAWKLHKPR